MRFIRVWDLEGLGFRVHEDQGFPSRVETCLICAFSDGFCPLLSGESQEV